MKRILLFLSILLLFAVSGCKQGQNKQALEFEKG